MNQNKPRAQRRPADWALVEGVLQGLKEEPKHLSPTYFYDERGSHLFDQICTQPEYYLTRTETQILESNAAGIAERLGKDVLLVELGSGASTKTRRLLDHLSHPAGYVPVDISRKHLYAAARGIAQSYPLIEVLPVCADFTQPFALPATQRQAGRVVVFFPGSTLGNFDPPAARSLLTIMRRIAGDDGGLLIGYDLAKDPDVLRRAYNDSAGVTADFNLNALVRLNREMGANFDLAGFRHEAVWVPEASRMEMHLISLQAQTVTICGQEIGFAAQERLVTEHCHKYTLQSFNALANEAGWNSACIWSDERRYFNVHYLV